MSRFLLCTAAVLYLVAAIGPSVPMNMRIVLCCYGVANIALAWAI